MIDTPKPRPRAAVLIIGNEILSGRTQDANLAFLAKRLCDLGIELAEARMVPDIVEEIVAAVNALRARYQYLFTTGGIGPTHDDITSDCVALAFGVGIDYHPLAKKLLEDYYGEKINEARLRMARVPDGATLIPNSISIAPGFRMENVFVLAGVPAVAKAMFEALVDQLEGGAKVMSKTISAHSGEGLIAKPLGDIQKQFPNIDIGSYPFYANNQFGTSIVLRGDQPELVEAAAKKVAAMFTDMGVEITWGDVANRSGM